MKNLIFSAGQSKQFFMLVLSLIFSYSYLINSLYIPESFIKNMGSFADYTEPYARSRFLLSFFLYHITPEIILDTFLFRLLLTCTFTYLCLKIFPIYYERVTKNTKKELSFLAIFILLICHFSLTKFDQVYYTNDIFSILISMYIFLLLTSQNSRNIFFGGFLGIIAACNRETIFFVFFQALGYWLFNFKKSNATNLKSKYITNIFVIIISAFLIFIVRFLSLQYLGNGMQGFIETMFEPETGLLRIYSSFIHLFIEGNLAVIQSALLFGCGIIFWLPFFWIKLNPLLKILSIHTLPLIFCVLIFGNFIELRCYLEALPIFSSMLFSIIYNKFILNQRNSN